MGDLSFLAQDSLTVQAIYAWHKKRGDAEEQRGYLGASIVGHFCDRYLWYTFRACVKRTFDGRMYRLFETGDLAEIRFATELAGIGCKVLVKDPDTNKQWAVSAVGGHFSGHTDGVVLGIPEAPKTWHVLECKTHNDESFQKCKKQGVKIAKPTHYAQMQAYMGLMKLDRALYLFVNKDTDELWSERVEYNAGEFRAIITRAERIIRATQPPERCSVRPDNFQCKFCEAHDLCWGTDSVALPLPSVTCRTCCHATPEIDDEGTSARWSCAKHKKDITPDEQKAACKSHLVIPGLLTFCQPTDSGEDWIEFRNLKDNAVWRHGAGAGMWATTELFLIPTLLIATKPISAVKEAFDGTVASVEVGTLLDAYPAEDSRLVWETDNFGDTNDTGAFFEWVAESYGPLTATFKNKTHEAREYGKRFLAVVYKEHNQAAIWEGVE
jgi:hypothetical protein